MKHPYRLRALARAGKPAGGMVIATAGVIALLGACVMSTPAPAPARPSPWGPPGAPSAHPGHAPPASGQGYGEEGYYEGEEPAEDSGEGYYEEEHAGDPGEGYYEEEPAGDSGEGYYEEEPAGDSGEGYYEEEPAGDSGGGHAAEPGHASPGHAPGPGPGTAGNAAQDLGALERGIVAEINRMRRDPRGFVQALQRYRGYYQGAFLHLPGSDVPIQTMEGVAAVDEAIRVARGVQPLSPMALSPGLSRAARDHAREIGAAGTIDHIGADGSSPFERMGRHGRIVGMAGENIGTGYEDDPAQVVIDLFVDDGVPSRGHRQNLLAPKYRVIGVGCAPHRLYGTVCVLDFAEGYAAR